VVYTLATGQLSCWILNTDTSCQEVNAHNKNAENIQKFKNPKLKCSYKGRTLQILSKCFSAYIDIYKMFRSSSGHFELQNT